MSPTRRQRRTTRSTRTRTNSGRVVELFYAVLHASGKLRSVGPRAGFEFWQPLKKRFPETSDPLQWKPIGARVCKTVMQLNDQNPDGSTNTSVHFFRQQVRIRTEEKMNVRRLLQIALNIGQWSSLPAKIRKSIVSSEDYKAMKLDSIDRYVTKATQRKLSASITPGDFNAVMDYCAKVKECPWRT